MRRVAALLIILMLCLAPSAIAEEQIHVLARGETIYTLARRYSVRADDLLAYNSIADPTRLPVGARIRIPGTYVVQQGEYVYSIAQKLGVNWLELLAANRLERDAIVRPGDVLLIPGAAAPAAAAAAPATTGQTATAEPSPPEAATSAAPAPVAPGASPASVTVLWPHPGARENYDGKLPGVLMSGQLGDAFLSVTSGVVEFITPFGSFGKLILVRGRDGYRYGYAGADRVDVRPGDRVEVGTVLGSVGFSPAFDSPKVLFTVWRNNRYIDPQHAPRG